MTKYNSFEADILDAYLDGSASGTLALGPASSRVNYTLPLKARLTTTVCVRATPGTQVSGGSYADQSLAGSMAAAVGGTGKSSNAALTYTGMPACTWADVEVVDSTGTPKHVVFRGGSSLAKTVNAGDTALIPSGSFTGTDA